MWRRRAIEYRWCRLDFDGRVFDADTKAVLKPCAVTAASAWIGPLLAAGSYSPNVHFPTQAHERIGVAASSSHEFIVGVRQPALNSFVALSNLKC